MPAEQPAELLSRRLVSERYNVTVRTIARWDGDPGLNFPQPVIINKRAYYSEAELIAFERAKVSRRTAA